MIKTMYYSIWSDGIRKMQTVNSSKKTNWKFISNVLMSTAGFVNVLFISALLPNKYLWDYMVYLQIDFSGSAYLRNVSFGATISCVFFIMNYMLIFRKARYQSFIDNYKFYNGKLFIGYFVASIWVPILVMVGGMILVRVF